MSVWVDDVKFYEDPEPALAAPVGGIIGETSKMSVAWLSPLSKAVPKGLPAGLKQGNGVVAIDSAKNEKEHFQVLLSAKAPLNGVKVAFDGFKLRRSAWNIFGKEILTFGQVNPLFFSL